MSLKKVLDYISPHTPTSEVQDAERENIRFDKRKVDLSIEKMLATKTVFDEVVEELVRDLGYSKKKEAE